MSTLDKTEKEKAHINDPCVCNKIDETLCIHHMKQHKDSGVEGTKLSIEALQPQLSIQLFKIACSNCGVIHCNLRKMMNKTHQTFYTSERTCDVLRH